MYTVCRNCMYTSTLYVGTVCTLHVGSVCTQVHCMYYCFCFHSATPLQMSAQKGHLPVVEFLVKHDAELEVRDNKGLVISEHIILYHMSMLHEAQQKQKWVCYLQANLQLLICRHVCVDKILGHLKITMLVIGHVLQMPIAQIHK